MERKKRVVPREVCAVRLESAVYPERYVRCCERTAVSHRLLLDFHECPIAIHSSKDNGLKWMASTEMS